MPTKKQISEVMAAMGAKGGRIAAKTKMKLLTPERRQDIARKAAETRWARKKG